MRVESAIFREAVQDYSLRIAALNEQFARRFSTKPLFTVSAPGRAELIGNHTDHNLGAVVASAINLDTLAVVAPTDDLRVTIYSHGWAQPFFIDLSEPAPAPEHDTQRLVRGVVAALTEYGMEPRGFHACMESRVKPGSGLSSSASIEALFAEIILYLNDGWDRMTIPEIARTGQYAENRYMGKPSGLMDQLACTHGGTIFIDFGVTPPEIVPLPFQPEKAGLQLAVVASGGDHADLTPAYAAVFREMHAIAEAMGTDTLKSVPRDEFLRRTADLRNGDGGDRALLRALHYFSENERVRAFVDAAQRTDFAALTTLLNASGSSSWRLLQNVDTGIDPSRQPLSLALALTEEFLVTRKCAGAVRVHGGGFAGTILTVIPISSFDEYTGVMERVFGAGSVIPLSIRSHGVISATVGGANQPK